MPQLLPFRGLRYDHVAAPDMDAMICPPYDIISASQRATLAARHPANAVHVELPESYARAAQSFAAWQRDGVLRREERPAVYVYEAQVPRSGQGAGRETVRGFLARLRLEQPGTDSGVRAHERTMAAPREDRFALLKAVGANLSPVVLLYEAPATVYVAALLESFAMGQPVVDATDDGGVRHLLWVADPAATPAAAELLRGASAGPLTIADGHHRYATALRYCAEVGGPGADQVLALLIEAKSGGLEVHPTHRLVGNVGAHDVLDAAGRLFEVEPVATGRELAIGAESGVIGMWTRQGGGRLRSRPDRIGPLLPTSMALRSLDVTVLNFAYPTLLGATAAELTAADRIAYPHDADEAVAAVESGLADVCFLLAPPPISAVLEVAAEGEVMPAKSTYFYPKPATGLVFNLIEA